MASSNSSLPFSTKDMQQWLNQINKAIKNHLLIEPNLPFCIFQLPQTLTTEKPHSYLPQHIGLGPIHHFRTELYSKQQQHKLITAKTILKRYQVTSTFEEVVVEPLKKLVPEARCSYELYFDMDGDTLAWVFALDGLFLLDVLSKIREKGSLEPFEDVMMVENQIPLAVLVKLRDTFQVQPSDDFEGNFLSNLLYNFCENTSPMKFSMPINRVDLAIDSSFHLLDCMYRLIINHKLPPVNPFLQTNFLVDIHLENVENAINMAEGLFPCVAVFLQPVLVVFQLPWDKIIYLFKKMLGENHTALEIDIPSVSKLSRIGKIEFCATPGGICDIEFDEGKLTFPLPMLDLKSDSEVILRNLVAYEGLMFRNGTISNLDFTEYVDLMCGIVDSVKDVQILREKSIINGDLGDEEIARLFNGITRSSAKTDENTSKLQKTIAKVNRHFGNIPRVKAYRIIKEFFCSSWKFFAIMFTLLSLVFTIISGVCQVHDCKGHFAIGNTRLFLAYATRSPQFSEI